MSLTVSPNDALTFGCPVLTKMQAAVAQKGTNPKLLWPLRDANGNPLDLAQFGCGDSDDSEGGDCNQVIFRFGDAIFPAELQQVIGQTEVAADGTVSCVLPDAVTDKAGLWRFQVAITDNDGKIQTLHDGLLSVERGFFGDPTQLTGPPTLNELRMEIRDSGIENIRLGDFEFADSELIYALTRPIRQWNERPPPIGVVNSSNFQYHYNWTRAAVGELLSMAAHNYRRNKSQMQAGGIVDQELDRDMAYEQKALLLRQEWLDFVDHKKVELNARMAWGTHASGWY